MIKAVCVTGVAGSGKTMFAKKLAIDNNYGYLDVNKIIDKNKKMIVALPVVTGKTSLSGIQILEGLSPGDEVVVGH